MRTTLRRAIGCDHVGDVVLRQNPIRDSVCVLLPAFKFLDVDREGSPESFSHR